MKAAIIIHMYLFCKCQPLTVNQLSKYLADPRKIGIVGTADKQVILE